MTDPMKSRVKSLSDRMRQVMRLVSLGCNIDEIGAILNISPNTAEIHRGRAMKRLGVNRSTLLARIAIEYRISPLDDKLTRTERRKMGR